MNVKRYGEFVASSSPLPTAIADHILGCSVSYDSAGKPEWVDLQYRTTEGEGFANLQMDWLNAMFVLSTLLKISVDHDFEMPKYTKG